MAKSRTPKSEIAATSDCPKQDFFDNVVLSAYLLGHLSFKNPLEEKDFDLIRRILIITETRDKLEEANILPAGIDDLTWKIIISKRFEALEILKLHKQKI